MFFVSFFLVPLTWKETLGFLVPHLYIFLSWLEKLWFLITLFSRPWCFTYYVRKKKKKRQTLFYLRRLFRKWFRIWLRVLISGFGVKRRDAYYATGDTRRYELKCGSGGGVSFPLFTSLFWACAFFFGVSGSSCHVNTLLYWADATMPLTLSQSGNQKKKELWITRLTSGLSLFLEFHKDSN